MVIHSPIARRMPVNNSRGRMATSVALTVVIVAGSIVEIETAVLQTIAAGAEIEVEALLENGHQVETPLALAIDLAVRAPETATMPIELEIVL